MRRLFRTVMPARVARVMNNTQIVRLGFRTNPAGHPGVGKAGVLCKKRTGLLASTSSAPAGARGGEIL